MTELARAYIRLFALPDDNSKATVSLASIGSYEIRMLRGSPVHPDGAPLFWLELFDHSIDKSVDSFICHRLEDAVPVFENFISQAAAGGKPDVR
jgi:hypothetical protein